MIMGFGKYKLIDIEDVPASYLLWCLEQEWFEEKYPKHYEWIRKRRRKLEEYVQEEENLREELCGYSDPEFYKDDW